MQLANVFVGIGGGRDTTVPKFGVTVSEIAVLRAIHGDDAVFDVELLPDVALNDDGKPRTNRQELARLAQLYGRANDGAGKPIVGELFPGAAARVFETLDELDIPDELMKPTARAARTVAAEKPLAGMKKADLVAYAKTNGIEIDETAKIDVIRTAIASAEVQMDDADNIDEADDPADGKSLFE